MTRTSIRILTVLALALGALSFAATSSAHDGKGDKKTAHHFKGHHNKGHHKKHADRNTFRFTTNLTSEDSGCGGHVWANDTIKRTYIVKKNADGSYRLTAFDRGTFTTVAGISPQGCPNVDNPHHGTTVTAGITGKFGGFLTENITGGTFNPNATCATVCDRAGFVSSFFGASAQQSANVDKNVSYLYVFMSKDPTLKYHVWVDRGHAGETGGLKTVDRGDIATV
jgi:hypothetical protein